MLKIGSSNTFNSPFQDSYIQQTKCISLQSKNISTVVTKSFYELNNDIHQLGTYVFPVLKNAIVAIGKTTLTLMSQATKVTLLIISLNYFIGIAFPASTIAYKLIVLAPITEEILFRGILQTGIEYGQKATNCIRYYLKDYELTEADIKAQLVFRVRVTALAFGLVHLLNDNTKLFLAFQVTFCTIHGITFGYYKEKTNSLTTPILLHAWNNTLAAMMRGEHSGLVFCAWVINLFGTCYLATRESQPAAAAA